jgi:hypothetical protein
MSRTVKGLSQSFSNLPCGKIYEGEWKKIQSIKKAHLKICVFCKEAIKNGAPQINLSADIYVNGKDVIEKNADASFNKIEQSLFGNKESLRLK